MKAYGPFQNLNKIPRVVTKHPVLELWKLTKIVVNLVGKKRLFHVAFFLNLTFRANRLFIPVITPTGLFGFIFIAELGSAF